MKKKIALLLVISMLIGITGCKKDDTTNASANDQTQTAAVSQQSDGGDISNATEPETEEETTAATVTLSDREKEALYLSFLAGDEKAVMDSADFAEQDMKVGQSYDYPAISEAVLLGSYPFEGCKASFLYGKYAFIDLAQDGSSQLVLRLVISDASIAQVYLFFDCIGSEIHLCDAVLCGVNTDVYLNKYGVLSLENSYDAYYDSVDYYFYGEDTTLQFVYEMVGYSHLSRVFVPAEEIAKEDQIEGYDEEEYPYCTDGAEAIYGNAFSFDDPALVDDSNKSEYLRNKFFSFTDLDGTDVSPRKYEESIYDEMGVEIISYSEANNRVKEHIASLGVNADYIYEGEEPDWQNLDSLGVGMYEVSEFGPSGMMKLLPGRWIYTIPDSAADTVDKLYLEINQDATFCMNIVYKDQYRAPEYAKGHIKFAREYTGDMYPTNVYFAIEEHNITLYDAIDWLGVFHLDKVLHGEGKADMTLEVVAGNFSFFKDQYGDDHPNFVSELSPNSEVVPYVYLLQPESTFYADDSSCGSDAKLNLTETSVRENNITDEEKWFSDLGVACPDGRPIDTEEYTITLGGTEGYGTKTVLKLYKKADGTLDRVFDLHEFMYARGYSSSNYVDRTVQYAQVEGDKLYVNFFHRTYASSCPENAYVMCIDLNTNEIIWMSDQLVSNSNNFLIIGDTIVTGYGFSAEDHYLSLLDKHSGKLIRKITVKKSPEYFYQSGNTLYVRTYSYDYEFKID